MPHDSVRVGVAAFSRYGGARFDIIIVSGGSLNVARQWLATGIALVALSGVLSACSGGSDDEPKAAATTTTSAAPATTTPAPIPTPAVQPQGANGVTWRIQDWETHQNDEAVLAWVHANETLAASINQGKPVAGLEQLTSKAVLRQYVNAINVSKQKEYRAAPEGDVKVLSSKTSGDRATLTMCSWAPTTAIRDKNNKVVGEGEQIWFKETATLSKASGQWVLKTAESSGTCPGGPPA
jgi:hypothetical protein